MSSPTGRPRRPRCSGGLPASAAADSRSPTSRVQRLRGGSRWAAQHAEHLSERRPLDALHGAPQLLLLSPGQLHQQLGIVQHAPTVTTIVDKIGPHSMYNPTTRLLTLLELLQARGRISGAELAERLEVDPRSVRRYVTMLQDLGIPITSERGRHGGYHLRRGFKLPPLMFTEDEALALTLGLLAARRLGLTITAPAVEGALAKIDRVLPAALRERVQSVQQTLVLDLISPETYVSSPGGSMVLTFSTAARQERRIWMRYRAGSADETERTVDPYGLVYHVGLWYMVGHCHLRNGLRVFRLDRVQHAELLDDEFTRPLNFDTLGYLMRTLATMPDTWKVEVLLETTIEEARQRVPPALATLEEAHNGVVLRCYVQTLEWIAHFLVSLRLPLVVREPPELRQTLKQVAVEIVQLAERTES